MAEKIKECILSDEQFGTARWTNAAYQTKEPEYLIEMMPKILAELEASVRCNAEKFCEVRSGMDFIGICAYRT